MAALIIILLLLALLLPLWAGARRLRDLPREAARRHERTDETEPD